MAQAALSDLFNKRSGDKLEKLYPGVTKKPVSELTIRDLNNITPHVMVEEGRTMNGLGSAIPTAIEIIIQWVQDKKLSLL